MASMMVLFSVRYSLKPSKYRTHVKTIDEVSSFKPVVPHETNKSCLRDQRSETAFSFRHVTSSANREGISLLCFSPNLIALLAILS